MITYSDKRFEQKNQLYYNTMFTNCVFDAEHIRFETCVLIDCVIFCANTARFYNSTGTIPYISTQRLLTHNTELTMTQFRTYKEEE